jgi:hypothetical protein
MALVLKDRVKETTTTAGTGTITLAGASTGYQSFSVIGNGNTTYYAIVGSTEWEVGIGTYTSSGTTLSRDTVLESSNSGSLVNFSAGSKDVFVTYPAERSVYTNGAGSVITPATASAVSVESGGTGLTSGTSGGVLYYSASNTLASSAALAANAIVLGGGAGAAPATTTTGTGVVTALSNNANATGGFATINGTATLTNKRIDPRVSSASSASSLTPDISAYDQYAYTALAANLTINSPTGTPVDGNKLIFRILDNGTARTLTWNATFVVIGVTLPTTTTVNKTTYVGCIYNANNTRWDVVAVATQA